MADLSRLEDLRRRVQKDPASIAFAQLAEELRRAGQCQESIDVCRAGLAIHPGYLSARVTLGRALLELNQLDDARGELDQVLKSAPENLAAIRCLAEIHHRRGELGEALAQYRAALTLARNDPDLEQTVGDLTQKLEPARKSFSADGLSFEQARRELSIHAPVSEPAVPAPSGPPPPVPPPAPVVASVVARSLPAPPATAPVIAAAVAALPSPPLRAESIKDDSTRVRAARTVAALEQWLGAIHVARAQRHA